MGIFDWLTAKSLNRSIESQPNTQSISLSELFDNPKLLADWINEFLISSHDLESDIDLLPSAEIRESFNITYDQREKCLKEYSVIRVAGYCLFVKKQYDDNFYLKFLSYIVPYLCNHIYPSSTEKYFDETASAIEEYVQLAIDNTDDGKKLARSYLVRVYDDNENYLKMLVGGVGYIGANMIFEFFEIMRDAYCRAKQGMSYESYKLIIDSMENKSPNDSPIKN